VQEQALAQLGLSIVRRIENLPTEPAALNALLSELQATGVEAIVTVALPPQQQ
jgi:ABC-type branched-subunit amino acid transport system substrate-binding protein